MILVIVSIMMMLFSLFLLTQADKVRDQKKEEIQVQIKKLEDQKKDIQINLISLKSITNTLLSSIEDRKKELDQLYDKQISFNNQLMQQEKEIDIYYNDLKNKANQSFGCYEQTLDKAYQQAEKKFQKNIKELEVRRDSVQSDLDQIHSVYEAAAAARQRELEEKEKQSFYKIKILDKDKIDIEKLEHFKDSLSNPSIVGKIIWSTYIMKPTTEMCNRVLKTSDAVCGIYKITNKITNEIYIGQSVNIADRWKQHIKCGLGIDASSTNKLYNNMQDTGVWNFTFQLLQKCTRDKLNEKEKFWIEMYQSNKSGLNMTKGNS